MEDGRLGLGTLALRGIGLAEFGGVGAELLEGVFLLWESGVGFGQLEDGLVGDLDEVFTFAGFLLFFEGVVEDAVEQVGVFFGELVGEMAREVLVSEFEGNVAVGAVGFGVFIGDGGIGGELVGAGIFAEAVGIELEGRHFLRHIRQ